MIYLSFFGGIGVGEMYFNCSQYELQRTYYVEYNYKTPLFRHLRVNIILLF